MNKEKLQELYHNISHNISHIMFQEFEKISKNQLEIAAMVLAYSEILSILTQLVSKNNMPEFLRVVTKTIELGLAEFKKIKDEGK
tara:strand:- start:218 stop:472 length:255 start_codon:yes stop_codon:yes gene_type:complete